MRRLKNILKKVGKGLLILIIVLAVLYSIAALVLGRMVEARINDIRESGQPVSIADIQAKPVPAEQNAAPLYEAAFDLLQVESDPELPDYHYSHLLKPEIRDTEPRLWDLARRVLEQNREAIALVEKAVQKPHCVFSSPPSSELRISMNAKARELSRLLTTGAFVSAADGRTDEAVHLLDLGFRTSRMAEDDGHLMSFMVSYAMQAIAQRNLQQVLQQTSISEEQARKLYDTLSSLEMTRQHQAALLGERAHGLSAMRTHMKSAPRLLRYASELAYLEMVEKNIEAAKHPYREATAVGVLPDAGQPATPKRSRLAIHRVLADSAAPTFERALVVRDISIAQIGGSRTALALEAYRSRYGSYPGNLEELRSKLGWEIPMDVFSGKDFVYKPSASGFLLYSLGPDLRDNGGKERNYKSGDYDIVWRIER